MAAEKTVQTLPEEPLKSNERLLRAAADTVHILLSGNNFPGDILSALGIIGEAADVDRVYIFEKHLHPETGAPATSQRYEWCRPGITVQAENQELQNLQYLQNFQDWQEILLQGKPVSAVVRQLPEPQKKFLEAQQIVSILLVPVAINASLWGFIGFDDCRRERSWSEAETAFLTTIAVNMGYILLHNFTEQNLKRFKTAIESTPDAIGMADANWHHFYNNAAFRTLFEYSAEELEKAGGPPAAFKNQAEGKQILDAIMRDGQWQGEAEMISRSGKILPLLLRGSTIKDEKGKVIATLGIFTDIAKRKEAERALQESETRYRRMIEAITDYIFTVEVDNGKATRTQHGLNCIAITGYSSEDYQADANLWINMVHPDDRERVVQQAQRILKGESAQPIEHRIYHKNGAIRWVRNTPVPHFDSAGRLLSYDGLVSDVTERRRAEEKLREHAYRLEILNRIIMAGNRVDNLNLLLNESLKASLEMVSFAGGGIYLVNAREGTAALVCQQNLPDWFAEKDRVLKITAAHCRMLFIEGQPIFTDDHSISSAEQVTSSIQSIARIPLFSKDQVIGMLVLINAQKRVFDEKEKGVLLAIGRQIGTAIVTMRSETALRESERRYRTITEQSLFGIQIIKNGRMTFVNDGWSKITGYDAAAVTGWDFEKYLKIVHPEDRPVFAEQTRKKQLGENGIFPIYDCRFLCKNGAIKWVSIYSQGVEFGDGRAIVGMIVDITERKQAEAALVAANKKLSTINAHLAQREQELLQANNEKEALLKEIHHRVKNNLQVINSLINLQMHNIADPQAVGLLKECQNRIKTIAMVHEKMYQLSDLAHVDVHNYLESLTRHLNHMYSTGAAAITIKVQAQKIFLPIDQTIPCALLVNELIANSFKHAFSGRQTGEINVRITLAENGDYLLAIGDNGSGLPKGIDFLHTKSLGLQLVTTFVHQLHGTIELENKPGTNFKIRFAQIKKED